MPMLTCLNFNLHPPNTLIILGPPLIMVSTPLFRLLMTSSLKREPFGSDLITRSPLPSITVKRSGLLGYGPANRIATCTRLKWLDY